MPTLDIIIVVAVFGLIFSLWIVCVLVGSLRGSARRQKIEMRLGLVDSEEGAGRVLNLWHDRGQATTTVPGTRVQASLLLRLDQLLNDARWSLSPGAALLALFGVIAALGMLLFALTHSVVPGLGAAVAVILLCWALLKRSINNRVALFERQFVDSLDLAARSLRAGHPLTGAFQLISEEVTPPVSTIFHEICQQQSLGVSLEDALKTVAAKSSSADLKLFATAVVIQLRTGGNLADMMNRLAAVIRERLRLNRRVRVLTAQTQFSKRVLLALPFLIFLALNLLNPEYMQPLYTTAQGHLMLALGGLGLLLGAWVMNRLAVLRY